MMNPARNAEPGNATEASDSTSSILMLASQADVSLVLRLLELAHIVRLPLGP